VDPRVKADQFLPGRNLVCRRVTRQRGFGPTGRGGRKIKESRVGARLGQAWWAAGCPRGQRVGGCWGRYRLGEKAVLAEASNTSSRPLKRRCPYDGAKKDRGAQTLKKKVSHGKAGTFGLNC